MGTEQQGFCLADGDVFDGLVSPTVASRAVREALRRRECEGSKFSLVAGESGSWDDEFRKLHIHQHMKAAFGRLRNTGTAA